MLVVTANWIRIGTLVEASRLRSNITPMVVPGWMDSFRTSAALVTAVTMDGLPSRDTVALAWR